jgi:hypothetical protein
MNDLKTFTDRMGAIGALQDDFESSWAIPNKDLEDDSDEEEDEPIIDLNERPNRNSAGSASGGNEYNQSKRMSFLKAARFDTSPSLSLSLSSWTAPRKLSAPAAPTSWKGLGTSPQAPRKMSHPVPPSGDSPPSHAYPSSSNRSLPTPNGRTPHSPSASEAQTVKQLSEVYSKLILIPFPDFAREISRKQAKLFLTIEPRDWLRHFLDRPLPPTPPKVPRKVTSLSTIGSQTSGGGSGSTAYESDTETISDETAHNSKSSLDSVATTVNSNGVGGGGGANSGSFGRARGSQTGLSPIAADVSSGVRTPRERGKKGRVAEFSEYYNKLSTWYVQSLDLLSSHEVDRTAG